MSSRKLLINDRIIRIKIAVIIAFCCIVLRLFQLQVHLADIFFSQGEKNFTRIETIRSARGAITDRNGLPLATNRPLFNLHWQGTGNSPLTKKQEKIIQTVASILDEQINQDHQLYQAICRAERHRKATCIKKDLNFRQLCQLEELFPHHENLYIHKEFVRYYPYKTFTSHILGYLGSFDIDYIGKTGLEKLTQKELEGQHGLRIKTINSLGRDIATIEMKKALSGNDVSTTIDIALQEMSERVFPDELSGALIVMDPHHGDILALVSRPNFDPSLFLAPICQEEWTRLQEQRPFLNRAFNASYPPGSIFKLVAIAAALENNIIQKDQAWNCKGYVHFGKRKYWCHRRWGHGTLNTMQAVAQSCNVLFYELGRDIDIDLLAEYAHRFGLGKKTNILFNESTGLIPTRDWKRNAKGERWWTGETLSACIGQSYLLTTPIQIACMISSIFTGRLIKPRILLDEPIEHEAILIEESTLQFLRDSMRKVVTAGTGRRINHIKDIEIHAKTSTAQTSTFAKRKLGKQYLEHAWFVSHVQYKQEKPITLVILVEHAGSSRVATNIAKDFLVAYKHKLA